MARHRSERRQGGAGGQRNSDGFHRYHAVIGQVFIPYEGAYPKKCCFSYQIRSADGRGGNGVAQLCFNTQNFQAAKIAGKRGSLSLFTGPPVLAMLRSKPPSLLYIEIQIGQKERDIHILIDFPGEGGVGITCGQCQRTVFHSGSSARDGICIPRHQADTFGRNFLSGRENG